MRVHVYSGLTSRCITLAHAYELCKKTGQDMKVIWPKDERCNIGYYEVFDESSFEGVKVTLMEMSCRGPEVGPRKSLQQKKYGQAVKDLFVKLKQILALLPANMIAFWYKLRKSYVDYNPVKGMAWSGELFKEHTAKSWTAVRDILKAGKEPYVHAYCGIINGEEKQDVKLNCIRFRKEYDKAVDEIMQGQKKWVGVHIRRTDHLAAIRQSSLDSFVNRMNDVVKTDPEVFFFLATDDAQVERQLKETFQDKIVIQGEKAWGRDSMAGMKAGVIDCLCLSRCEYILGSYTSVFSLFAANYGGIVLHICQDEEGK